MSSIRLISIRTRAALNCRQVSTETHHAVEKLRDVLEEYRQLHYGQETRSRFKKEIVAAACKTDSSVKGEGKVRIEGIQQVLSNIGAGDQIDSMDLRTIFKDVGNSTGEIPASDLLKIL